MAITIKTIPTLKDKAAKSFNKNLKNNSKKRGSIDFSKQVKSANNILRKSKSN